MIKTFVNAHGSALFIVFNPFCQTRISLYVRSIRYSKGRILAVLKLLFPSNVIRFFPCFMIHLAFFSSILYDYFCSAGMAELADALASGASDRKVVQVQVLFSAPY